MEIIIGLIRDLLIVGGLGPDIRRLDCRQPVVELFPTRR